jgi:hypothetical protein
VHLLYAAASRVAPADAYRLHYAFLALLLSLATLVAVLAVRSWLPRAPRAVAAAIAPVFALGFWGQYVFDINAWSQLSSAPVLLLAFVLLVEASGAPREGLPPRAGWRLAGALAVLVCGATYLYPENLVYHVAVLVPVAAVAIGLRAWRAGRLGPAPFVPLLGVAGMAAGALYWKGTLGFVLGQVKAGTTSAVPWWHFFQGFFFGRTGEPGAPGAFGAAVDFLAGFLGLYFATPSKTSPAGLAALQRVVLAVAMAALVAAVAAVVIPRKPRAPERKQRARGKAVDPDGGVEASRLAFAALACVGLYVPAVRLATSGQLWSAGKAVSFASPVLVLLLTLPLAVAALPGRFARLRWVTGAFVAFQLAIGLARVAGASNPDGIHFEFPYPSLQEPPLKKVLRWEVEPLATHLSGVRRVLIADMNPWSSHWLMCFLYARGVDFFKLGPVVGNFGAGEKLGQMTPPWSGEALVGLSGSPRGFVVQYADGRPPAVVAWPERLR